MKKIWNFLKHQMAGKKTRTIQTSGQMKTGKLKSRKMTLEIVTMLSLKMAKKYLMISPHGQMY
ncbi:MAG: hypothetical protein EBT95_00585 [Verrucomicrobia bacterium]|nr:hypothetical protein [Verrucomicrobiota bacterium]